VLVTLCHHELLEPNRFAVSNDAHMAAETGSDRFGERGGGGRLPTSGPTANGLPYGWGAGIATLLSAAV
jgi:hypothetical protein